MCVCDGAPASPGERGRRENGGGGSGAGAEALGEGKLAVEAVGALDELRVCARARERERERERKRERGREREKEKERERERENVTCAWSPCSTRRPASTTKMTLAA